MMQKVEKKAAGKTKSVKIIIIAAVLLLAFGAVSFFAFSTLLYNAAVPSPRAVVRGMVIHYQARRTIDKYSSERGECWISYEVEGKKYYNRHASCGFARDGDTVNVLYQTTDPQNSAVDNRFLGNCSGVVGILLIIFAGWQIRVIKKKIAGV